MSLSPFKSIYIFQFFFYSNTYNFNGLTNDKDIVFVAIYIFISYVSSLTKQMSSYKPTNRQLRNAYSLGVNIKPSSNRKKKLDVFDYHWNFICSIGDIHYGDYDSYIKTHGLEYATQRKNLYKQRHERSRHHLGTASYYADQILWS